MTMKQRKVRVPYTNYKLPPSAEQGGQFVDFNKVMKESENSEEKQKCKHSYQVVILVRVP